MSARNFLISGLVAGFVAGILAFAVAHTLGEPSVNTSIAFEESHSAHEHSHEAGAATHSHDEDEALVSRDNQSTWGLLTATLVIGTAFGGIVALVSAFAAGRLGTLHPAASTALVCALGFVSYYLVPLFKYPPNPPAIGNADTIGRRTAEYFSMVVLSIFFTVVAVAVAKVLTAGLGLYWGLVLPVLGFILAMVVAGLLLPHLNETPKGFSADVLWRFRVASIATQATLWGTIGIVLPGLVRRAYNAELTQQGRRDLVGTAL